jgi:hypothetical protein
MNDTNELTYIGPEELTFHNDEFIHSGGFSVNSIMMKAGMSPIMTYNLDISQKGGNNVSDLFKDLVIPNWALTYNNRINGGSYKHPNQDEDSDEDDVIDDDIHDKLVDLVKATDDKLKKPKKNTRNIHKKEKKNNTKKKREIKRNKEK